MVWLRLHTLRNDFYVDDGVTGDETEAKAIRLAKDLQHVLAKSGFVLDKWRSNSQKLLSEFGSPETTEVLFEDMEQTSILGVKWLPNTDHYTFNVNTGQKIDKLTKRIILSKISQLFDPNGYVTPAIIPAKILMQHIWSENLKWDAKVPSHIENEWNQFWSKIGSLESIKIPRWAGVSNGTKLQLHGFADSSIQAYGCSVLLRAVHPDGKITCHLIASKSRVAPLKQVTIPRLELAAAELLSQLMYSVRQAMELSHIPYFLWTDNTIALHWIGKPIHMLKLYVANRVKKIQELTDVKCWHHIRTHENPADLISRGMSAANIVNNSLWWHGPEWLCKSQENWPKPINIKDLQQPQEVATELKVQVMKTKSNELEIHVDNHPKKVLLFNYTKNLGEIKRILTYVRRFVDCCKRKYKIRPKQAISADELKANVRKYVPFPTDDEMSESIKTFVRREQQIAYPRECAHFAKYGNGNPREFPEKSALNSLNPRIDEQGIIRVGGRIGLAELPYDTRHPIIIPSHSRLSRALILEAHRATNHGGNQLMIQYIRVNYWIPKLRAEIKNFTLRCTQCTRYGKRPTIQMMADLPADRIVRHWAFQNSGVDYAGPFLIKETYKRNAPVRKCWVVIIVCMCTRAVHLDVVADLSSAAFINCYERFVASRGHCSRMYSDNGTSFVGAYKGIKEAFDVFKVPENIEILNRKGTKWIFMSPASPHQGGIYEAAVKSAKYHLTRVIGHQKYVYDDYLTLLKKIEAILNSRPLYAPSDDPFDAPVITPAHLVLGRQLVCPPPISTPPQSNFTTQRVRNEQQKMIESFWKSWSAEYLVPTLITRKKWQKAQKNVEIGQVVLVKDDNLPPSCWQIGKIIELLPSKDNLVRSVVIETASKKNSSGEYKKKTTKLTRAVQKICILPTENELEVMMPEDITPLDELNQNNSENVCDHTE